MPPYDASVQLVPIPPEYAHTPDPTTFGAYISKFEAKIDMADSVKINVYLTPASGYSLKDFDISISSKADGPKIVDLGEYGGQIYIKIDGIKAYDMDKDIQIQVKLKGTNTSATWTRSLMSCAYDNYQGAGDNMARKNLMMSLYQYFKAAQARWPNLA